MKALTLTQPWATLMALRLKRIETRSWSTQYTGTLAIHASKAFPRDCRILCTEEPFCSELLKAGFPRLHTGNRLVPDIDALPLGAVLATCLLYACQPIIDRAQIRNYRISSPELAFGNYAPGRYMLFTESMKALEKPILAKGQLGLWEWEAPATLEVTSSVR